MMFIFLLAAQEAKAQVDLPISFSTDSAILATDSASTSPSNDDVTKPEEEKEEIFAILAARPAQSLSPTNFMAYWIQFSIRTGVPANTIILILLLPVLATIVAFLKHVVGLPSLGMLVSIALSITLLATGITAGLILLTTIILASTFARAFLKRIRIMQLPKIALSFFVVSMFVLGTLTAGASLGLLTVKQLSIFPVLLLILLSERIVALQLTRSLKETFEITVVTLSLGVLGFFILSSEILRTLVLVYPEFILILIPINIIIGRYFGLRITEFFRFSEVTSHGSK